MKRRKKRFRVPRGQKGSHHKTRIPDNTVNVGILILKALGSAQHAVDGVSNNKTRPNITIGDIYYNSPFHLNKFVLAQWRQYMQLYKKLITASPHLLNLITLFFIHRSK